ERPGALLEAGEQVFAGRVDTVRDVEQALQPLLQLRRYCSAIPVCERRVVRLHGQLPHPLEVVDDTDQRFLFEAEAVPRERAIRLILLELRKGRADLTDARGRERIVGRLVDAAPGRNLRLRFEQALLRSRERIQEGVPQRVVGHAHGSYLRIAASSETNNESATAMVCAAAW